MDVDGERGGRTTTRPLGRPRDDAHGDEGRPPRLGEATRRYLLFGATIATATVAAFGRMYVNTHELDHVHRSERRVRMALIMGATMPAIMLGTSRAPSVNVAGPGSAVVVGLGLGLWPIRGQETVRAARSCAP